MAVDLRGRGDSDKPPAYPAETHRDALCHPRDLDALIAGLGLEHVHYVGHSLGAWIGLVFASIWPHRVRRLVLVDGGHELRPEVVRSVGPALERLGVTFPSIETYLDRMQALPFLAGRWNPYLERYFGYDAPVRPDGTVASRVSRAAAERDLAMVLSLTVKTYYPKIAAPTLVLQAPGGLLTDSDCLMSREEAERVVAAIPDARLLSVPDANHYTILLARQPRLLDEVRRFLEA